MHRPFRVVTARAGCVSDGFVRAADTIAGADEREDELECELAYRYLRNRTGHLRCTLSYHR